MTLYSSCDIEYEDIYDFDYLLEKRKTPPRRGQTYTLEDAGSPVQSLYRLKTPERPTFKLPAIEKDNTRLEHSMGLISAGRRSQDRRAVRFQVCDEERCESKRTPAGSQSNCEDLNFTRRLQREPTPFHGPRPREGYYKHPQVQRYLTKHETREKDWDLEYELLAKTGDFDPQTNPRVQEYERRHGYIGKPQKLLEQTPGHQKMLDQPTASEATSGQSHVFTHRIKQYEDSIQIRQPKTDKMDNEVNDTKILYHDLAYTDRSDSSVQTKPQNAPFVPAPPTIPKPPDKKPSSYARRRFRFPAADDCSHQTSTDVTTDYDYKVREALSLQRELEQFHKDMTSGKVTGFEEIEMRQVTAATANSNLPGRTTPCAFPKQALPTKITEPVRQWDGHTAKRCLGFKSKVKKEPREPAKNIGLIPASVRRQMKRYFS